MCNRGNARAFIKDLERVRPTAIIGTYLDFLYIAEFRTVALHYDCS